jgi:DnaK suppressor protein
MSTPTSSLTPDEREQLRAGLHARREQLHAQLALHEEGRTRADHARDLLERDYDDAPQRAMDREVDIALSELDRKELDEIDRALGRLGEDDFGVCADCGQAIPFARLRAEPYAMRCVGCESRRERRL